MLYNSLNTNYTNIRMARMKTRGKKQEARSKKREARKKSCLLHLASCFLYLCNLSIRVICVHVFVLIFILLHSTAFAETGNAIDGKKIYTSYCLICHGKNGRGDGPLSKKLKNMAIDLTMTKKGENELFAIIKGQEGKKGHIEPGQMPEWGAILNDPSIRNVVAYIKMLGVTSYMPIGDHQKGAVIYKRYCSACHGLDGKGDGPLVKLLRIRPTDHTDSMMSLITNDEIIEVISHGAGTDRFMPAWGEILSKEDIENLVGYIRFLSAKE